MTTREMRAMLFELPDSMTVKELRRLLFELQEQDSPVDTAAVIEWARQTERIETCKCSPKIITPMLTEYTYNPACTIHDGLTC